MSKVTVKIAYEADDGKSRACFMYESEEMAMDITSCQAMLKANMSTMMRERKQDKPEEGQ